MTPVRKRLAAEYLRQNPHRLHLGIVGLELYKPDGGKVAPDDISDIQQTLDLWNGKIQLVLGNFVKQKLISTSYTVCYFSQIRSMAV